MGSYMNSNNEQTFTYPAYRWVILGLTVLSFLMSMVPRFAWPPLQPVVIPVLNLTMTEAGAYMTAFYIGYVITQIPSGMMADRFSLRLILTVTMLVQGISTFMFGMIDTYTQGFVLRVISGLAGGCVYAACFKGIFLWFSARQRGFALGIIMTAPSLGPAMANMFSTQINALWGWRAAFEAIGVFALICAILTLFFFKQQPADLPVVQAQKKMGFIEGLKTVGTDRNVILLSIAGIAHIWAYVGYISWGNTYLKKALEISLGAQPAMLMAGSIMTGMALVGVVASPISGFFAGREERARPAIMGLWLFISLSILAFGYAQSLTTFWIFAIFVGIGLSASNALITYIVSSYSRPEWAATTVGLTGFFWQIGGIMAPIVIGMVIDSTHNFTYAWWLLAAAPFVAIASIAMLRRSSHT